MHSPKRIRCYHGENDDCQSSDCSEFEEAAGDDEVCLKAASKVQIDNNEDEMADKECTKSRKNKRRDEDEYLNSSLSKAGKQSVIGIIKPKSS